MKITHYFRTYLEEKGYLELPSIGKFTLNKFEIGNIELLNKGPEFISSKSKLLDTDFINYLCKEMKSEIHVVRADVESFSSHVNELLLQGLEVEIPGIGYLLFSNQHQLKFAFHYSYIPVPRKRIKLRSL